MLNSQSRHARPFRYMYIWVMLLGIMLAMILTACGQAAEAQSSTSANQPESRLRSTAATAQVVNEIELIGVVTAISNEAWTIDGRNIAILPQTEISGAIAIGSQVTIHAVATPSGGLAAREIALAVTSPPDDSANGDANANQNSADDSANGDANDNSADDNANGNANGNANANQSDDGATHDQGDDHGGGRNDRGGSGSDNNSGSGDNSGGSGGGDDHRGSGDDHGGSGGGGGGGGGDDKP